MFSWYKYLIVSLFFSHLGFWSRNLFLIAPFPDLCLLVPFLQRGLLNIAAANSLLPDLPACNISTTINCDWVKTNHADCRKLHFGYIPYRYMFSKYKYLNVNLFSHRGFWCRNFFLIAPFPDHCLLVPFSC